MGIDIHVFREIRIGNKWYCVEKLEPLIRDTTVDYIPNYFWQQRDYDLFYHLAGVLHFRESKNPKEIVVPEPRGLPEDVSEVISRAGFTNDAVTYRWLSYATYDEIDRFLKNRTSEKYQSLRNFRRDLDDNSMDFSWNNQKLRRNSDLSNKDKRIIYYFDC